MDKYSKIKQLFEQNRDEENAIKMSKYMRDLFKFYGIPTPVRKSLYKDLLKEEKAKKTIDWNFLDKCYEDDYREFQYLALDYIENMQKFLNYDDIAELYKYIKSKQWWDTIDRFDRIVGNIAFKDDRINDLMLKWSKDEDFWLRRIAIDHQLGRKDKTNTKLLEQILINNFGSDEFFINKAIGWSLRDYSKTNPDWVKDFLNKYENKMNKISLKEAYKYI